MGVSGTVSETYGTAGAATAVVAARQNRLFLMVQNVDASGGGVIWVSLAGTASATNGVRLDPGGTLEFSMEGTGFVPSGAVSVFSATTPRYAVWEY
jgi:hypothetical protein